MPLMARETFEVYYFQNGRWSVHASYEPGQRELAIEEAKNVESTMGYPTRVVRETFYPETKTTELQVATDVTSAALTVSNAYEAVQASQVSRELSEKRLEAAQSKFEVGMATNFEVVQAQRDLNDARNSELRQLLNYRRALVDFERVQISPR